MFGLDSFWHWIILLVVVLLIFGTGKLARMGPDLGNAVRGFKKALHGEDDADAAKPASPDKLQADPPPAPHSATSDERDTSGLK
ncbi:MAG TPA: twin-arginine translocase TatA/TatE family subunit [Rhodanobacteraceae bacterium]|jgi:sec-independent protein translocase protein TatA|nr:twin-arginine translocase TatA/TatE family subunit [Rhodanobacteraceae bacterium]